MQGVDHALACGETCSLGSFRGFEGLSGPELLGATSISSGGAAAIKLQKLLWDIAVASPKPWSTDCNAAAQADCYIAPGEYAGNVSLSTVIAVLNAIQRVGKGAAAIFGSKATAPFDGLTWLINKVGEIPAAGPLLKKAITQPWSIAAKMQDILNGLSGLGVSTDTVASKIAVVTKFVADNAEVIAAALSTAYLVTVATSSSPAPADAGPGTADTSADAAITAGKGLMPILGRKGIPATQYTSDSSSMATESPWYTRWYVIAGGVAALGAVAFIVTRKKK
jgi:hypothetical protein